MSRLFIKIFSSVILTGLIFSGLFLRWRPAYAENQLQSIFKEVMEKVGEISNLKKNESLNDEERREKELRARKEALSKIFDLTLLEDQNLKNKLTELKDLNEEEVKIKDALLGLLAENESAYDEMRNRLEATKTIEDVKQLAIDFKNWRKANYNPKVEKIVSFSLVFQQNNTLAIAQNRLKKIKSDLEKLESAELIKKEDTGYLLQKSASYLKKAEGLNNQAKDLVIKVLQEELFPMEPSADATKLENPEEIKLTPQLKIDKSAKKESASVKTLVEDSLNQIKSAYRIFIEIGKLVREKINK